MDNRVSFTGAFFNRFKGLSVFEGKAFIDASHHFAGVFGNGLPRPLAEFSDPARNIAVGQEFGSIRVYEALEGLRLAGKGLKVGIGIIVAVPVPVPVPLSPHRPRHSCKTQRIPVSSPLLPYISFSS